MKLVRRLAQVFGNCGIGAKIRLVTLGTAGAALLLASLISLVDHATAARRNKASQLESLAEVLGANSAAALEFNDPKTASDLLASLASQPTVEAARLYDAAGNPFATYPAELPDHVAVPATPPAPSLATGSDCLEVAREVVHRGEKAGAIYVRATTEDLRRQVRQHVLTTALVLLVALTASTLMVNRLQRLLSAPIYRLAEAMRRVTAQGDCSVRVAANSRDELGILEQGFNVMLDRLEQGASALQEAHDKLERRVEQRTAELRLALVAAEAANRAKSQFLANMSHEIRTPMTAILGYADLLFEPDLSRETRRDYAETIRRNGDHLLGIINDILDISKVEAGKMTVEQTACSPRRLADEVVSMMQARAKAKNLLLEVEYRGPIPDTITTDPTRLRQILMNLVGNGLKFTQSGSVRLAVRMLDALDAPSPHIGFEVIDTGVGIAPEHQAAIFEPFSQADGSMTRRFGGTGLGLAISKRFAGLLGGDITVQSELGRGSRFLLAVKTGSLQDARVVQGRAQTPPASATAKAGAASAGTRLSGRILLAEDGADNQEFIALVLKKAGAEVTVAENGKRAIDEFFKARGSARPFHCILMDMQMPVLDGYAATRQLRAAGCRAPIIALTAHAMQGDRERCLQAGCDDYASKPIQRAVLVEMVARHLKKTPASNPSLSVLSV